MVLVEHLTCFTGNGTNAYLAHACHVSENGHLLLCVQNN